MMHTNVIKTFQYLYIWDKFSIVYGYLIMLACRMLTNPHFIMTNHVVNDYIPGNII